MTRVVQGTKHKLVKLFFPPPEAGDEKRRPTTTAFKIKSQAQKLVKTLLECSPHYVRTVKSNETKSKKTFDRERVLHQVQSAAAVAVTCVTRPCPCRSNTWGCWRTSRWAPVQRLHIPSDTHVYP
jgi:hypothetical protein